MLFRFLGFCLAVAGLGFCALSYLRLKGLEGAALFQYYHPLILSAVVAIVGFTGLAVQIWVRKNRLGASGWIGLKAWLYLERLLMVLWFAGAVYYLQSARAAEPLAHIQILRQFLLFNLYLILVRLGLELGRNPHITASFQQGWEDSASLRYHKGLEMLMGLTLISLGWGHNCTL